MPRAITSLVIHCTDTPNGRWTTVDDIDKWHRDRGFKRTAEALARQNPRLLAIGYHRVIYTNGAAATGRANWEIGAHAQGANANSLGLALVGKDRYTLAQWDSLATLVRFLCDQYRIPLEPADTKHPHVLRGVLGHRELPGVTKTCPGFDVRAWLLRGMNPTPDQIIEA